ncbi:hypothetical protein HY02_02485 [Peptococcaceae bacterium SCADC1_2_3]|nr:hypothetical protein HY02_02485 [Peptococcaceae bacterium SCADC1_2_3]
MKVENLTPLVLKETENKELWGNDVYIKKAQMGTFYQILNASLLTCSKQKAVQTTGEESWEAVKNMLPKETQNYVAKAMALLDKPEKKGLNTLSDMETPKGPVKIELALESNPLKLKDTPKNLPGIQSGLESNLLKFPQLKEIFSPQNLLLDEAMVLITNQEQGRGQNNNYTQGRWYSEQPYTSQNIKTKEVDLNSLTGEVDYIPNVTTINYWI